MSTLTRLVSAATVVTMTTTTGCIIADLRKVRETEEQAAQSEAAQVIAEKW
jgi:hypothetical protein